MSSANRQELKVLHIASGLGTGGAETMLFRLLRGMPDAERRLHCVLSLSDNCAFDFSAIGVNVKILDLKRFSNPFSALWSLRKLITQLKPQLIHTWMYHANIATTLAAPKRIPIIWGIHHALQNLSEETRGLKFVISIGKLLSRIQNVVHIIFVSYASERQHLGIGYTAKKSLVIPNGIDTIEFFPSEELRRKQRAAMGIPDQYTVIGSFGRFHPIKDHGNLIEAVRIVRSQAPLQQLVLLLAGKDMDSQNKLLVDLIDRNQIADCTRLLGPQTDMCALYNSLDLYILSSKSESLPNVLAESLACGTPVVTTDVGDAKRMIPDPSFCVEPNNSTSLANEIYRFISLNQDEIRKLKHSGRSHIVTNFNIENTLSAHLALYEKVIGEWTN